MKKRNFGKVICYLLLVFFAILLTYSLYNIVIWFMDNKKTSTIIDSINNVAEITEVKDNENTEIITTEEIEGSPYWEYIKMNLLNVDFNELKSINNEVVGWIEVGGTNINYPFVKTNNNDFYLTHSFDKNYNTAGWVFMDYRNNATEYNQNTILYAHGRADRTMFGSLRNILEQSWLGDENNFIVRLSTEYENTLWEVFSVYKIPTTSDYLQIYFEENEFLDFSNMLAQRSIYNFNVPFSKNDKILTLSTCANDDYKIVLHAKLIKKEIR